MDPVIFKTRLLYYRFFLTPGLEEKRIPEASCHRLCSCSIRGLKGDCSTINFEGIIHQFHYRGFYGAMRYALGLSREMDS